MCNSEGDVNGESQIVIVQQEATENATTQEQQNEVLNDPNTNEQTVTAVNQNISQLNDVYENTRAYLSHHGIPVASCER